MYEFKEENDFRDGVILFLIACALCLIIVCGCGNSSTVKPSNELNNKLKTSLDNQQAMSEKIETMTGNLTKIQQNISSVVSQISTIINQKFETFQDAVSNKIGEVGRDVNTKTSKTQNSSLYGIGVVAVALIFALACVWFTAQAFKTAAGKLLR